MGRLSVPFVLPALLALGAASTGCSPELGQIPFLCNNGEPQCPDGYECKNDRYCVKIGTCPATVPGCSTTGCGNGSCDPGEDAQSCSQDCRCGNSSCDPGEDWQGCPQDCIASCGNGSCDPGEDQQNCKKDCLVSECGNGTCEPGEDLTSCPDDCHCGNGKCDPDETPSNCPTDCSLSTCGDKKCDTGETHKTCPADCPVVCGDKACDFGETSQNCPGDCPGPVCGDSKCEPGESGTCPVDCPPTCSDSETHCENSDTLQQCVNGAWKSNDCNTLCKQGGYDYSSGCQYSPSKSKDVCICGDHARYGEACDANTQCDSSLICAMNSSGNGFCTRYCGGDWDCLAGAPTFSDAYCNITLGGKKACGFICGFLSECPPDLECGALIPFPWAMCVLP